MILAKKLQGAMIPVSGLEYIGSTYVLNPGVTNPTINIHADALEGDLAVLLGYNTAGGNTYVDDPVSFTTLARATVGGNQMNRVVGYKVLSASDISTGTFTITNSSYRDRTIGFLFIIRGADTAGLVVTDTPGTGTDSTTITLPDFSATAGRIYIGIGGIDDDNTSMSSYPSSFTTDQQYFNNDRGSGGCGACVYEATSSGTISGEQFVFASSDDVYADVIEVYLA